MKIRAATERDFEQVGNIFLEELQFHAELLPERFTVAEPIMTLAWFEEILQNSEKALTGGRGKRLLRQCTQDGRILGQVLLNITKTPDDPNHQTA